MENQFAISDSFFSFIRKNIDADPTKLLLKKHSGLDFDLKFAVLQIECRKKILKSFPKFPILNVSYFLLRYQPNNAHVKQ